MARIIGLGGVFFKSNDKEALLKWYHDVLELDVDAFGYMFEDNVPDKGFVQWSPFSTDTDYFAPSEHPFMINFRVDDLDAFLEGLAAKGINEIGERVDDNDFGKFAYILDPDGTKLELWEPPARN
jgi:predicted enzyme related to lactoylglutathione lyase